MKTPTREDGRRPRFFVRTFGCQMNENDSERLAGLLAGAGMDKAAAPEEADVIIVNTCAVREKSEEKLYSYLGRLSRLKKARKLLIGVAGCVAQVQKDALFRKRPFLDFVIGPQSYPDILSILERAAQGPRRETPQGRLWREVGHGATLRESASSAYVTIMEGCDNFCSYCIVPFSRGREKSRPMAAVLAEVRELAAAGYKEVQLLGQNVNSYRDPGTGARFSGLLGEVASVPGPEWIRFLTSHPRDLGGDILDVWAAHPTVCRQLHLPLQSGSTAVLGRMNRGYTRGEFVALTDRIKAALPGVLLSTDVIVGFPGETDDDFEATLAVVQEVGFDGAFTFVYSPRTGTEAATLPDQVPDGVKRERIERLVEVVQRLAADRNALRVGGVEEVLVEGPSRTGPGLLRGRTRRNTTVNFDGRADPGDLVPVRITGASSTTLRGTLEALVAA
jgi:tRNA-2-methylthio-N6-dimethylallyladenosine synthase